jgi:site-specific DNA recombinase
VTTPPGRRPVVIYCRISDDREGRQNGVDRQERQCRALAERNGDEVVRVFVDDDRSAYSGKPRPDYNKMLAFLDDGQALGVYALAPTRLYRRLDDGLAFFKLINERQLAVETVKQGRYDLGTADGRRDALRAAIDAQYESELIGERVRDAKADSMAQGLYRGGPRPFGFESDGVTVRTLECPRCPAPDGFTIERECKACGGQAVNAPGSEAWHLERAIDAVTAGESLRSLERRWKELGVRAPERRKRQPDGTLGPLEAREWRWPSIRKVLMRPRNAGLIDHDGEVVGRAAWARIVDEGRWRACVAVLTNPERRKTTSQARVWIGSSLYRCWCGEPMKMSSSGPTKADALQGKKSRPAYRCSANDKHCVRDGKQLDRYIQDLAVERLSREDAVELLLPPAPAEEPFEDLAAQANALRAKLDSIAADYAADLMTRKQMLDATALTRKRLEKLSARMETHTSGSVLAPLPLGTPEIAEQWPSYHLDKKRAIIDALMTVTVHKGRKGRLPGFKPGSPDGYFDPDTIEIDWKSPA